MPCSLDELKGKLKSELNENEELYQNFSQSSIDIKEELNQILTNPGKYYVNETVDLPWSYLRLVVHKAQYTKWQNREN